MKIKNVIFVTALLLLFCVNSTAQTAERQAVRYNGDTKLQTPPANTVWAVDFVKTNDGQQATFLKFIEQNWAKARQTLKEKGKITSYQVLSLPASKTTEWDVLLLTEYANADAHDKREELFAEVFKTQPTVTINGVDGKQMREIKFSRVFTKPISSEIGKIMLETQNTNPEAAAARIPLENYLKGQETGNPEYIRKAFHAEGRMTFVRDGKINVVTGEEFAARFTSKPAPDEAQRKRWIESVDIFGNAAVGKIILDYPTGKFTDYMTLLKVNGEWKIINKSFHFEPKAK